MFQSTAPLFTHGFEKHEEAILRCDILQLYVGQGSAGLTAFVPITPPLKRFA